MAHYAPVIGADLFLSIKLGRYYWKWLKSGIGGPILAVNPL